MQCPDFSEELKLMVKIILNFYAPLIFEIKENWHVSQGSIHYFNALMYSRNLLENEYPALHGKVLNTLKNNGFNAHPESLLISMVCDSDPKVKDMAVEIIKKKRETEAKSKSKKLRKFEVPKNINFKTSKNYYELIDFTKIKPSHFTSPPLLRNYSIEDLQTQNFTDGFNKIPNHSQHVEYYVSLTSQSALKTTSDEKRHEFILNKCDMKEAFKIKSKKSDFLKHIWNKTKEANP